MNDVEQTVIGVCDQDIGALGAEQHVRHERAWVVEMDAAGFRVEAEFEERGRHFSRGRAVRREVDRPMSARVNRIGGQGEGKRQLPQKMVGLECLDAPALNSGRPFQSAISAA